MFLTSSNCVCEEQGCRQDTKHHSNTQFVPPSLIYFVSTLLLVRNRLVQIQFRFRVGARLKPYPIFLLNTLIWIIQLSYFECIHSTSFLPCRSRTHTKRCLSHGQDGLRHQRSMNEWLPVILCPFLDVALEDARLEDNVADDNGEMKSRLKQNSSNRLWVQAQGWKQPNRNNGSILPISKA